MADGRPSLPQGPGFPMNFSCLLKLDLRRLILFLAVISVLVTLANGFYASYEVQRALLIRDSLAANRAYAAKLAETTDIVLKAAQDQLAYSAGLLRDKMDDEQALMAEARRLHQQTDSFDSVVVVGANAVILAASPDTLGVKGLRLSSPNALQSLNAKRPLVTDPFVSPSGNYILAISHPVFTADGNYLGYISGSIYLRERNILANVLERHFHQDGSHLYVVDRNGTLIYHPEAERVGENITGNPVIEAVLDGRLGAETLRNSKGVDMLAGFAPVTRAGWGVVAQRPRADTLAGLDGLMLEVFMRILPLGLLTLSAIWLSALFISRPLWQLAQSARVMDQPGALGRISTIRSWYFEASRLKRAILKGAGLMNDRISQLHTDSHTDAPTGLLNRRGLEQALESLQLAGRPVALITLDIDHFKQVNDRFGHDVGDQAIGLLAQLMKSQARKGDLLCRSGGEEFLLLLPDTELAPALEVAERLRRQVAGQPVPVVGRMTISLGLARWAGDAGGIRQALKRSDEALYRAKAAGRNRTECASE